MLEQSGFVGARARECAADMTEELGLEEVLRNRRAVDADERAVRSRARPMDRARDDFLPGAAFTGDEHGRIVLGNARHQGQRLAHGAALGDQAALGGTGGQLRLEACHFFPQPFPLLRLAQRQDDFIGPKRLGQVVVGALFHGRDRGVLAAVCAHDNDEGVSTALAILAEERQAVHFRHPYVAQHQIERLRRRALERAAARLLRDDRIPGVRQQQTEALPQTRFVIDNEDSLHEPGTMGKNSLNAAPPSRAPSTQTTPPISCTERATIARPRPVPWPGSLVV